MTVRSYDPQNELVPSNVLFPSNTLYPGEQPVTGRFSFKQQVSTHPYPVKHHPQIIKDDDEIMELISMIMNAELL